MKNINSGLIATENAPDLTLADIIDRQAFQTIMEDFYSLTNISNAIIDTSGEVLIAVGWQDICVQFHRLNPVTLKNCLESDLLLTNGIPKGEFRAYRCKNNLWDMATPIEVEGRHLGNVFLGQFFYDDEMPDRELFRRQARQYGFDEKAYLEALERVPRWSRENVRAVMKFYAGITDLISSLSYGKSRLDQALSQKEQALRRVAESEKQQRAILRTAMDGFYIIDMEGKLLDVNETYCRMSGYSARELLAMRIHDLNVAQTAEEVLSTIRDVIQKGQDRFETRHRRKDGTLFDVEASIQYQATQGGRIVVFVRDITERKQAEMLSRHNEARLQSIANIVQYRAATTQALLDHALDEAIKLTDSAIGFICLYNEMDAEFRLTTWSKNAMEQCRVIDPPSCFKLDQTGIWGEAVRRRAPFILNDVQGENPLKKAYPHGHVHLSRFMSVPVLKNERIVAIVGVANKSCDYGNMDALQLTLLMDAVWTSIDMKKGEDELRDSEKRYRELFESSRDGVVFVDTQARIMNANKAYCDMLGYTLEELKGKESFYALTPPRWHAWEQNEIWPKLLRHEGYSDIYNKEYIHKNGTVFPIELQAYSAFGPAGQTEYLWGVVRDVTDRKRAEEEKVKLETQLQRLQKMESIGTLAGGIAHDFNNILTPILAHCDMMLDDLAGCEHLERHALSIRQSAQRAAKLVKQILTFSRQSEAEKRPMKLQSIIHEVAPLLRNLIPSNIEILLNVEETGDVVMADASQMHQVLMNLATNAYQAMEKSGGKLEIGLRTVHDGSGIPCEGAMIPGQYLDWYVSDTGTGIEEKDIGRIFDPYFTTKEPGKGTGLGLAISYGIIKKHGGAICVSSRPGEGSAFHVYLPVLENEFVARPAGPKAAIQGGTEHLLFVDDEYEILDATVSMLRRLGYQVTARTGSIDALAVFRNDPGRFDIVITDMTMPNLSGIQLAEEIHQLRPELPIILCTGFSQQIDDNKLRQSGITALLMKPIIREQLAAMLRNVLDGPGLRF